MVLGVDFQSVAIHELGHSLGLAHSPVFSSIMFPYYKGPRDSRDLNYDDVMAMYDLYSKYQCQCRNVPERVCDQLFFQLRMFWKMIEIPEDQMPLLRWPQRYTTTKRQIMTTTTILVPER